MLFYYATLFTFGTNSKHFVDKNSGKLLQSDACSKIFWVIAKEDICNGRQWLVYLFSAAKHALESTIFFHPSFLHA